MSGQIHEVEVICSLAHFQDVNWQEIDVGILSLSWQVIIEALEVPWVVCPEKYKIGSTVPLQLWSNLPNLRSTVLSCPQKNQKSQKIGFRSDLIQQWKHQIAIAEFNKWRKWLATDLCLRRRSTRLRSQYHRMVKPNSLPIRIPALRSNPNPPTILRRDLQDHKARRWWSPSSKMTLKWKMSLQNPELKPN
jgi:hypothetical protein